MKRISVVLGALLVSSVAFADLLTVRIDEFKVVADSGAKKADAEALHLRLEDVVRNTHKFTVVERNRRETIAKELELVDAGLTDGDAPESNSLIAANYDMYGSILRWRVSPTKVGAYSQYTARLEAQLRFTNIATGKILGVKTVKAEATRTDEREAVDAAAATLVRSATNLLIDVAYPTKVLAVNAKNITVNLSSEQCKVGDVYDIYEVGEELVDPVTGESLGCDEELVGQLKVERPGAKFTKCVVCPGTDMKSVKKGMTVRKAAPPKKPVRVSAASAISLRDL